MLLFAQNKLRPRPDFIIQKTARFFNSNHAVFPDHVIYVASDEKLEALAVVGKLQDNCYGGMPIQVGYCNGTNTKLNCLEYHKDSEINIAADDAVLLVARLQDASDGPIDSSKVAQTIPQALP